MQLIRLWLVDWILLKCVWNPLSVIRCKSEALIVSLRCIHRCALSDSFRNHRVVIHFCSHWILGLESQCVLILSFRLTSSRWDKNGALTKGIFVLVVYIYLCSTHLIGSSVCFSEFIWSCQRYCHLLTW